MGSDINMEQPKLTTAQQYDQRNDMTFGVSRPRKVAVSEPVGKMGNSTSCEAMPNKPMKKEVRGAK